MKLTGQERERYNRHILLKEIGEKGVEQLREARVLVVGAGGLGATALYYLAAAGVGTIGVIDGDRVDVSNLQRQIIHFTADIGKAKTVSVVEKIKQLNPAVKVEPYSFFLSMENGKEIVPSYDYVLECTDNNHSKFMVNDLCVQLNKPFTHGSVIRFEGRCMTYVPGSACYRCLYSHTPDKETAPDDAACLGILGAVPGTIGAIQATEAIKYLTGTGELLTGRMLLYDALAMAFRVISLSRDSECLCRTTDITG